MKQKNILKKLTILLFILIFISRIFAPIVVLADDPTPTDNPTPTTTQDNTSVTPTDTPTDTPTPTTDPNATPTNNPTPTIDPNASPTDSPTPSDTNNTVNASNNADVNNNVDSTGNTGINSVDASGSATASDSATPTPTDSTTLPCDSSVASCSSGSINTGNATSVSQGENNVNTTSINSTAVNQTINVFFPQDGNIDLSDPSQLAANVVSNNTADGEVFNISIVNNNAYVDTNVTSIADTGDNTASGQGEFAVNTGNATSLVELVNKVNVTLVNSEIHFITINIYGTLNGNIILPELVSSQDNTSANTYTNVNNNATVNNNVDSTANTGTNGITTDTNGTIHTGSAYTQVNLINLINEIIFGFSFDHLVINDLGTWNGNFLGWGDLPATNGGTNLDLASASPNSDDTTCATCTTYTSISNNAVVNNNISSFANTGGNTIANTGGKAMIVTGNAESIVSLINLINSVFINSKGFFAFINIFGTLNGDIGGASKFPTPTPTPDAVAADSTSQQETGGQLSVTNANNVGAYVLPGDTVTFFVTVHNPGTGKVYGAHLHLGLIKDGVDTGGADYSLGDIPAGHSVKLTTGLVLSHKTPGGVYTADTYVTGNVGPDNSSVSADATSTFAVYAPSTFVGNPGLPSALHTPAKSVLAAHSPLPTTRTDNWMLAALLGVLIAYIFVRILRGREHLIVAFAKKQDIKQRLNSLRLFLL